MFQMIKGTSIELADTDPLETVENVLIGEPTNSEIMGFPIPSYLMAIPKGDNHSWIDRVVKVSGIYYRTVGYPEMGIEENIPLMWHKKVRIELLMTNASCTVYEKDGLKRHLFKSVLAVDFRGEKTLKSGDQTADDLKAYFYGCLNSENYRPKAGDLLVLSESDFEFDCTSEQTISNSMTEFRKKNPDFAVIKSVSYKLTGELFDYEITAQ